MAHDILCHDNGTCLFVFIFLDLIVGSGITVLRFCNLVLSVVDFRCCVNFCCTAKWFSYTYIYTYTYISEKAMAPHSSTLAWKIPWTEEPGRLQSMGSLRVRLSDFTFSFHLHALEKETATHSSVLAWRIPGTGEPGGLPSMGSHRVRHDWSDLAAAAAVNISDFGSDEIR